MGFANKLGPGVTLGGTSRNSSRSLFAQAKMSEKRTDIIPAGDHVVEVVGCEERNERHHSYLVTVRIIESDTAKAGGSYVVIHNLIPPYYKGLTELKAFAVAAGGFGPTAAQRAELPLGELSEREALGEAQYDALDDQFGAGAILAASTGEVIDGAPSLVGCKAHVRVELGKAVLDTKTKEPTGDHYRVCTWSALPDDEVDA